MLERSNTVAASDLPPCRHCGRTLQRLFFDATGRVEIPKTWVDANGRKRRAGERNVPLFPAYTVRDVQDGVTAPPAIVCPSCDEPDPTITDEWLSRHIEFSFFALKDPADQQPESD